MRKHMNKARIAGMAAALMAVAPIVASAAPDEHYWSAKPEGTAWVTGYGECWQSKDGPDNLEPCVNPVPKEIIVRLNFEFDKYRIENVVNDSELARLDDYIAKVKRTPAEEKLTIVGHTDAKGTEAYNYTLGMRRAQAVRDYMVSRGIPASDIVAVESMGETQMLPEYDMYAVEQRRVVIRTNITE